MSTTPDPRMYPPPPPPRFPLLGCALAVSFFGNILAGLLIVALCIGLLFRSSSDSSMSLGLTEKHFSGSRSAREKIAIINLEGVIMEGMLDYVHKQIEQAGKDEDVKAVVLRINSPGGSITASDDLHRRILELRDGNQEKKIAAHPLIVSMGSIAASGGYYVAAPAAKILAERSTITGSIGVYASFPNAKELSQKIGFTMNTIKAGAIKDAGSPFRDLSETEHQAMQDMVDDAYVQFLEIVQKGRPQLKREVLLERFTVQPLQPDPKAEQKFGPPKPYTRYRADGGIFTALRAKELGLVDAIGTLEDAVTAAAESAELQTYRAIRYLKPKTFSDFLLGTQTRVPPATGLLGHETLRELFRPRLWYLAPGYEMTARMLDQP